jgi:hypothetical protein
MTKYDYDASACLDVNLYGAAYIYGSTQTGVYLLSTYKTNASHSTAIIVKMDGFSLKVIITLKLAFINTSQAKTALLRFPFE